jgi:GMP synthase (glutamine-hydrolysing)
VRIVFAENPDGGGPGVFGEVAEMERWRAWEEPLPDPAPDVLVVYGGSTNVADAADEPWLQRELRTIGVLVRLGVPVLGLCLGGQLLAAALGAEVARSRPPEIGWHPAWLTDAGREDPVLSVFDDSFVACQWHSWAFGVPSGASCLAMSAACPQAFRYGSCIGVQFHPEVDEPTLSRWIDGWRNDPDAVERGFDPDYARAEMRARLPGWNDLGRRLFRAFLDDAA